MIVITNRAKRERAAIERYILSRFGPRSVSNFRHLVKDALALLKMDAKRGQVVEEEHQAELRKWILHRNLTLFFEIHSEAIVILSFWDNRRNPTHRPGE